MTRSWRSWTVGGALLLVATAVAWWALQPAPRPVDVVRVTRGDLVQRFEEEGRTELPRRWLVSAPIAGTLQRITLLPGDRVQAGAVVARIEPARGVLLDPANRARLQAEVAAAVAAGQAAAQRQAAAHADAVLADRDVRRMRALGRSGAISVATLDEAEARLTRARAATAAAAAEHRAAAQQRSALQALLGGEGRRGGTELALRAPIDGVVLHRYQESVVPVQAGQALLELGDLTQLQVMVQALSQQVLGLHPGTPAWLLRWGGEAPLPARVLRVEPGGYTKVSALGVEEQRTRVWLQIVAPRAHWQRLGDGFRVEVAFEVARRRDVLQVPASALFRAGRQWAVFRVVDGRARLTPVRVGLQGSSAVQVLDGLRAGEQVVAYPDDRLGEGRRVRVVTPAATAPPAGASAGRR